MRPFVALFCLFLRHTFWKVLLLLAALGAAEWAIFRFQPFPPTVNTLVDAYTGRISTISPFTRKVPRVKSISFRVY